MGRRIVLLPHVRPSRWIEAAERHRLAARDEFAHRGPTAWFHALQAQAHRAQNWARDLQHLEQVVAQVNAEMEGAR